MEPRTTVVMTPLGRVLSRKREDDLVLVPHDGGLRLMQIVSEEPWVCGIGDFVTPAPRPQCFRLTREFAGPGLGLLVGKWWPTFDATKADILPLMPTDMRVLAD